jgi:hypothetical protein
VCKVVSFRKFLEWMKAHPAPLKRTALAYAELIVLILVVWYATFPASQWASAPNYLSMYLAFLASNLVQALFSINTGPTGDISWLVVLGYMFMAAHVVLFLAGKRRGVEYIIANWRYLIYMVLLGLFTISFQNAAHNYGWYWNPSTGGPGYVDTWTHIVSAWFIGSLALPFAFERYLGWERKYFWIPPLMVLVFFSAGWELAENVALILHPGSFFTTPINSIQDLIFGTTVAPILATWLYQRLVMDQKR